ncbi:MAG: hydrogenase nickel incorporation protein HypB [Candidatus Electrothrix sp. Rat3]|nr:hydrogenase nickel incorporation protein HypB [Candidatus Electrothrix rattekaaiensis]
MCDGHNHSHPTHTHTTTRVPVAEQILSANDRIAQRNHSLLHQKHVYGINIMASPGAGKTSVLLKTLEALKGRLKIGVIEGDPAGSIDTDRAIAAGMPAVQVNTGGECHLDAVMMEDALSQLPLDDLDLVVVENVGNLICPANFRLGTHLNLVIASIPEGDDKPYKYPGMYMGMQALIINKIDLLPYVPFDMEYFQQGVEVLNPGITTFPLSCQTGEGLDAWTDWLVEQAHAEIIPE